MTGNSKHYVGRALTMHQCRELASALARARSLLVELETERDSAQIDRVRHGAMHEIETATRILGVKPDPATLREPLARDRKPDHVLSNEPLPFGKQGTPCGVLDAACGLRGGSARCGGCSS